MTITADLDPNEQILWRGRPNAGPIITLSQVGRVVRSFRISSEASFIFLPGRVSSNLFFDMKKPMPCDPRVNLTAPGFEPTHEGETIFTLIGQPQRGTP